MGLGMTTMSQFEGRIAVITGGGAGLGREIALKLLSRGAQTVVIDHDARLLAALEEELRAEGRTVEVIRSDVRSEAEMVRGSEHVRRKFARVDVLVNNVGGFEQRAFEDLSVAEWREALELNVTSVFICSKAFDQLIQAGGCMINISSSLSRIPEPSAPAYCVAKAGVDMLTRCLALALARRGIRVVAVAPGPIEMQDREKCSDSPADGLDYRLFNPSGRFARPEEIAELVCFIASPQAGFMTGNVVDIDGGESASPVAWSVLRRLLEKVGRDRDAMATRNLMEAVRRSTARVAARASSVRLCEARLVELGRTLEPERVRAAYRWESEFHYRGDPRRTIDYVFTLDAMNFGSGFSPQWKAERAASTYQAVAASLKRHLECGGRCDAGFAASATVEGICQLLGMDPGLPLAPLYVRSLNQLGAWVRERFGDYSRLLESLHSPGRAAALVALLAQNLSFFDDTAEYDGETVCFYKRAQILVSDLHLALAGRGHGFFPDLEKLTMFADNLVPHVLRLEGVLDYEPGLLQRIEAGELLAPGSPEEIEIRAAGVQAVEGLCRVLREAKGATDIFPAMLDVFLWNLGQDSRYKSRPRHLCQTFCY
jgi:NAD(P)-dependent dehydrogenase (short-subunit alcohol dehydrogenase family)